MTNKKTNKDLKRAERLTWELEELVFNILEGQKRDMTYSALSDIQSVLVNIGYKLKSMKLKD